MWRGTNNTKLNSVPASNFVGTLAANVDNEKMSDVEFRQFVRNTLPIVEYNSKCWCGEPGVRRWWNDGQFAGHYCERCWRVVWKEG